MRKFEEKRKMKELRRKKNSQKDGVQQVDNMRWQRARTNDGQRL